MKNIKHPPNTVPELDRNITSHIYVAPTQTDSGLSNSVNHKVIGSEIVQQRIDKRNNNNVWDYITRINKALTDSPIKENGSIHITMDFAIDQYVIDQLIDTYEGVGWIVTYTRSELPQNGFPGLTAMVFDVS